MKHFLKSSLLIIFSLLCGICHFSEPTFAASFSLSSSTKQVSPGATFTVSVGGDCVGRVNLKVSNGSLSNTAIWVEENYQTITVTAGSSGTVTVTATPEIGFSDPNGDDYSPGSRSVSVAIVTPTPPTTPTTPPASTNQTKPSASSKPSTSSNNQTPTSTPAAPEESEKPEENQETKNEADTTDDKKSSPDETSTSEISTDQTENTDDSDICSRSLAAAIIAWIVAGIFGLLFLGTLIALIYILLKYRPISTSEKPIHPSTKTKSQKSSPERKSKSQKA